MISANGSVGGDDGLDMDAGFVHKVRPAAGLARVRTAAPNSVFALGGGLDMKIDAGTTSTAAPARKRSPSRRDRAIETLRSCGALTLTQFAEAMELSSKQATQLLSNMKVDGKVQVIREKGALNRFAVSDFAPLPVTQDSRSRRPGSRTKPTPVVAEIVDSELACAFYNTGELVLEAPGSPPLRLSPRQAKDLIQYLQRCTAAAASA